MVRTARSWAGVVTALTVALALAACFKVSNSLPPDAPSYVKLYPGAHQVIQMKVAGFDAVAFQAPGKVDEVMAFYRSAAQAEQMPELAAPQADTKPGQVQAVFGNPEGERFMVVTLQPKDAATMVSLTYKAKPKS